MKTFSIGDRVRVIGPNYIGDMSYIGEKFTITQQNTDGHLSCPGFPFFAASSLELDLKLGDIVQVINESAFGKIVEIRNERGNTLFKLDNGNFYAAECLKKRDQSLQIGDYVEIVGPDIFGTCHRGEVFKISNAWIEEHRFCGAEYHWHNQVNLRKLTDSEIAERLNQPLDDSKPMFVTYEYQPDDIADGKIVVKCTCGKTCEIATPQVTEIGKIYEKLNWLQDQIDGVNSSGCSHGLSHIQLRDEISDIKTRLDKTKEDTDRRLDAGEHRSANHMKQLDEIERKIAQFDKEIDGIRGGFGLLAVEDGDIEARMSCKLMKIEKRLEFIEKFQKDLSESRHRLNRSPIFGAGP